MAITQIFTADDVFELEDDARHELIDGELFTLPGSGGRSSSIGARFVHLIGSYLDDHPIGYVLGADGSFVLAQNPDTMLSPDAAFINLHRLPDCRLPTTFIQTFPDLAVEVLSPSDRRIEAERKSQRYLDVGTSLVWLVDPKSETVTVFRQGRAPRRLTKGQTLTGEDVLPGFATEIDAIFK